MSDDRRSKSAPAMLLADPVLGEVLLRRVTETEFPPGEWRILGIEQALRSLARCHERLPSRLAVRELDPSSWQDVPVQDVLARALRRDVVQLWSRAFDGGGGSPSPVHPVEPRPARPAPSAVRTWIGVHVVDSDGGPLADQLVSFVDPDGARHRLVTDGAGDCGLAAITAGLCDVSLSGLHGRDWHVEGGSGEGDLRVDTAGHVHTVTSGECLSSLARRKGFRALQHLVDANEQLLGARTNPNVLAPGDSVVIPDRLLRVEPCGTGRVHVLVVVATRVLVRLQLISSATRGGWRLLVGGREISRGLATFDERGAVVVGEIPASASRADLELEDAEGTPSRVGLLLGRMPPWNVEDGWRGRLHNLGYVPSASVGAGGLRRAVALFQRDQGLAIDGEAGPKTLAALRDTHGC